MQDKKNPILITFNELRRTVGWLGILLPFVLSIGLYIMNCCPLQNSISQYYYTRMGSYLTGTLCAVGLFLIAYKGYPGENDGKWCNFAGLCAFGVAFIPMDFNKNDIVCCPECIVFYVQGQTWFRFMHFVSAGGLFLTMSFMCYFKFTKTNKDKILKNEKKHSRNLLYRVCGIIIFSCLLILGAYNIIGSITGFKINTLTFFMESIMLIAFGTAWLVKGEGIKYFND